jgi:hypothetical protein
MKMGTIELKSNIHKIVDSIQSEQFLQSVYEFLKERENSKGGLWDSLSERQKQEVMLAFEESEDENNITDGKAVLGD